MHYTLFATVFFLYIVMSMFKFSTITFNCTCHAPNFQQGRPAPSSHRPVTPQVSRAQLHGILLLMCRPLKTVVEQSTNGRDVEQRHSIDVYVVWPSGPRITAISERAAATVRYEIIWPRPASRSNVRVAVPNPHQWPSNPMDHLIIAALAQTRTSYFRTNKLTKCSF